VRLEQGINIAGSVTRVIGQGHRSAAEYVEVRLRAAGYAPTWPAAADG
jgi:hypothetical protein